MHVSAATSHLDNLMDWAGKVYYRHSGISEKVSKAVEGDIPGEPSLVKAARQLIYIDMSTHRHDNSTRILSPTRTTVIEVHEGRTQQASKEEKKKDNTGLRIVFGVAAVVAACALAYFWGKVAGRIREADEMNTDISTLDSCRYSNVASKARVLQDTVRGQARNKELIPIITMSAGVGIGGFGAYVNSVDHMKLGGFLGCCGFVAYIFLSQYYSDSDEEIVRAANDLMVAVNQAKMPSVNPESV